MSRYFPIGFILLLLLPNGAAGASSVTVAKNVSAQAGPWAVTLSINYTFPYADSSFTLTTQPAVFSAVCAREFRDGCRPGSSEFLR
jgi:hypothetical protein